MKTFALLLFLLSGYFNSFSQLGGPAGPSLRIMFYDSITGKKIELRGNLKLDSKGKLLIEANPNDIRTEIYDTQLLIEVIHARGPSVLATLPLTGINEFERSDVLKTLRPALQKGDRIVLTFRMMSEREPSAYIIKVM